MEKCRLCLLESYNFSHISEICEEVPLSVVAMLICPVEIYIDDDFPQFICGECVKILCSAYQLRNKSRQSELFLRELVVKQEFIKEDNPIDIEVPTEDSQSSGNEGFTVNCFKTDNRSFVWKHFGALSDSDGNIVDDDYFYCAYCVKEKNLVKYSKENATTCFSSHLQRIHNISQPPRVVKPAVVEAKKVVETFHCNFCNRKLTTKIALKRHVQRKHEPKRDPSSRKVTDTIKSIPKDTHFIVDCFKPRKALNSSLVWDYFGRLLDSTGAEVETGRGFFFCRICNDSKTLTHFSVTNATTGLMNHLAARHGISADMKVEVPSKQETTILLKVGEKGATCLSCNESFDTGKAYYNHLRSVHVHNTIEASNYVCHVCSKSFSKNYILTKHMKIHSGVNYFCSLCPASFSYPEGLKRHEKIHDPSHLSKYQCDQCPNSYAERKSLKLHITTVHLNQSQKRNFPCEVCGMKFITSNNLKKHVMKHTGEKPHACKYCEISYTQKGDLIKHLQRTHNTMYTCHQDGCSASFRLQVELREHYSVHFKRKTIENR